MSKILLIDDEETNVRVLAMSLRSDGHEILSAISGQEGLAVFNAERPEIVITDIKMPGMDGIEVLRQIKIMEPDAEVIIITGHGDIDNAIEALKLGASDFINKPIRDDVMTVAIQRAEEKRSIRRQLREYTDNLELEVCEATEEIQRKSNFQAKLIGSSNDGIIATDHNLEIVIFNPAAHRIFGYTENDVVGKKTITAILPADLTPIFTEPPAQNDMRAELARQEIVIQSKSGELIPVYFYTTPLYEKKQVVGTVSFFQDLREIKRLEHELVQVERLAAIGQTVAGVAHGVKNILHGFKGGSYLVNLGIEKHNDDKLVKGWDLIQRNINRTHDLVMDLLSYAKERPPEFEPCNPNRLVMDVCEVMQGLAKEHQVKMEMDLDPAIQTVSMDPRIIHQCLSNLVSNAIDACLFDENVIKQWQVSIRTILGRDRRIHFIVADNGAGMNDEVKAKLFTSFFSTKGHRGTGLGLLVTRKSVEAHGGTVNVTSTEGKGTTFDVALPYRDAEIEYQKAVHNAKTFKEDKIWARKF
jgi:two-component system NtrC family sensor kinase